MDIYPSTNKVSLLTPSNYYTRDRNKYHKQHQRKQLLLFALSHKGDTLFIHWLQKQ